MATIEVHQAELEVLRGAQQHHVAALGLGRSLYYALQTSTEILGTPVPPAVLAAAQRWRPSRPVAALMSWCYSHALQPAHPSAETAAVMRARGRSLHRM